MFDQITQFVQNSWRNELDLLFNLTIVVAAAWFCLTVFIYWRRSVTNLTPVDVPSRNQKAQPDFLKVDHKKRNEALKRGDAYAKKIGSETAADATAFKAKTVVRIIAVLLSFAVLAAVLIGAFFPESTIGQFIGDYTKENQLMEVIKAKPIAIGVAATVLVVGIFGIFLRSDRQN